MRLVWSRIFCQLAFAFGALVFGSISSTAQPFEVEIFSKSISNFKPGSTEKRFGQLEFVGGLEFTSSNQHVGALSGMVLMKDRRRILAVTDTGFWFAANVKRNANGAPIGLENARMAPLLDRSGEPFGDKWLADAESIVIDGDNALISLERNSRVLRYKIDLENFASVPERVKLNIDVRKLRANKSLETIVVAPQNSPLKGSPIIVSERTFARKNEIIAAIIDGPMKGLFTVRRKGKFDITDGDFLPDGDLLLLERRFNLADGIGMRIRKIKAEKIKPGAVLKGKKLIKANSSYQIDNMEGLSITTDEKGNIYLSLISDDNHSLLQRNLYLEFRLVEEE